MKVDKKKLVLPILAVLSIIIIGVGVTLAFFSYTKEGNTENTIELGNLTFHYDEISGKGRGINLDDALPVDSDNDAKSSNDYFDFRITANTNFAQIPYVITARLSDDSNLDNSIVKIYLTKVSGNTETEVLYTTLDQLENKTFLNNGFVDKVLYRDTVPVNGSSYEVNYRLRMWIAQGTDFSGGTFNNKHLSLTVNVYTNEGNNLTENDITSPNDTRIKMVTANNTYLLDDSNETGVDYEVNVPYEVNTSSINTITQNVAANTTVTSLGQSLAYGNVKRINSSTEYSLLVGDNYFRVDVTAADGNTNKSYILDIVREFSKDNNLTYLAVENYAFTEPFDKDTTTYHVSNAVEANSINIIGNKSADVAQISGTGSKNLVWGENTFTVTVTPQDPNTQPKVYTIIVNNVRPGAPSLTGGSASWVSSATISVLSPGTAVSSVDYYEYYISDTNTTPSENVTVTGTTQDSVSSFTEGTHYVFYRTVSQAGNKSEWSSPQQVNIDLGPTVATLTSAPSTKTQITANYTATTSISDIKSIKCYYGTTNDPATEVAATGNNCVFTSLAQDTTYYFKKCTTSNSDVTTCSDVSSKLTAGHTYPFNYNGTTGANGSVQTFTVPYTGTYKLEAYGAQGGTASNGTVTSTGGKGGYIYATTALTANTTLYVAVGGQGQQKYETGSTVTRADGGYNGGAQCGAKNGGRAGSGGGATTIATANGTIGNGLSASNTLIVAGGGGGGAVGTTATTSNYGTPGAGGNSTPTRGTGGVIAAASDVSWGIAIASVGSQATATATGGSGGGSATKTVGVGQGSGTPGFGGASYSSITGATMQAGIKSNNGYAQITIETIN